MTDTDTPKAWKPVSLGLTQGHVDPLVAVAHDGHLLFTQEDVDVLRALAVAEREVADGWRRNPLAEIAPRYTESHALGAEARAARWSSLADRIASVLPFSAPPTEQADGN